jgi:hypothetical protein
VSEILTFKAKPAVRLDCTESIPFCLHKRVEITVVSMAKVPVVVIVPPVMPVALFVATELTDPLLLKAVQSAELKAPLLVAEAVGRLKV